MATKPAAQKSWVSADLTNRLMFLIMALFVFRFGSHIPVPGVDPVELNRLFESASGGWLGMLNMFSGGAIKRFSVLSLGVMPYISAAIIMQMAGEIVPQLKALKKEGEAGRRVITKYTRIGTVLLAALQALASAMFLRQQANLITVSQSEFLLSCIVCLTTGTMFLMWLGEQVTERGVGNGISMIICAGIAANIPGGVAKLLQLSANGSINLLVAILIVVGALFLVWAVVFLESCLRKVPIHYPKRQVGNRIMQAQGSYLPFKLNMSGVIPPIFASSLILFPATMAGMLGDPANQGPVVTAILRYFSHGTPVYLTVYTVAIVFFAYFYTALVFSPKEIADNLKRGGAFIPTIRPGEQTALYLERVVLRLTFWGAIYIAVVCLIPEFLIKSLNVPFYMGGTSLLILVVVIMDFNVQLNSYRLSSQYERMLSRDKTLGARR